MKILIACNVDSYPNPYVKTLYDGFVKKGIDVICSIEEFWHNATSYDIIHIQWPNLLVDKTDETCSNLNNIIRNVKLRNIPLVCTCHNLVPHYNSNEVLNNVYKIVYNNCDYIHHLGEASIQLLKDLYPGMKAKHFIVPHHTYDEIYDLRISKKEARRVLGIPQDVKCLLSMGTFRHDEERDIIISLSKKLSKKDYYILAPGFFRTRIVRKNVFLAIKALFLTIKYAVIARSNNIHISHKFIPDEILPLYLKAADLMLIQRKKILNSGNVSLAMLAGLPIVGPDEGNVGALLKESGNFVFYNTKLDDLPTIIEMALSVEGLGHLNYKYAESNLTTSAVADSIISFYITCLQEKEKCK